VNQSGVDKFRTQGPSFAGADVVEVVADRLDLWAEFVDCTLEIGEGAGVCLDNGGRSVIESIGHLLQRVTQSRIDLVIRGEAEMSEGGENGEIFDEVRVFGCVLGDVGGLEQDDVGFGGFEEGEERDNEGIEGAFGLAVEARRGYWRVDAGLGGQNGTALALHAGDLATRAPHCHL